MIYETRYQAEKARRKGEEIVARVTGGWMVMSYSDYRVWKNQK